MAEDDIIAPRSRKQHMFVNSDADVTVFGGAAGATKSYSGLMSILRYIQYKNFRGVVTRRTFPMLKGSGGLLDTALKMFNKVDPKVRFKAQENKFVFSSGAEVYLKHFEHEINDERNWQGLQISYCLVDEATQFVESQVLYMMSRLRNADCPQVKPRIALTCNPDKNSFLRKWIDWWLDEDGYPIEERCGVKRYFIRKDGGIIFADTAEELIEKHKTPTYLPRPLSLCFINANIYDNPVLMKIQPDYLAFLEGLGRVEKARLLHG